MLSLGACCGKPSEGNKIVYTGSAIGAIRTARLIPTPYTLPVVVFRAECELIYADCGRPVGNLTAPPMGLLAPSRKRCCARRASYPNRSGLIG